ncbi:MAG: YitT family protein [Acetivibrio ethanolgignens]
MLGIFDKKELKKVVLAIAGCFLFALGVNIFTVPIKLYSGGFIGIGQIVRTLLVDYAHLNLGDIDIAGIIYFLLNVPLFILAYRSLGQHFFWKTAISVVAMTVAMTIIRSPSVPIIEDPLAACFIAGLISGTGVGITLRQGASGGGQDILGVFFLKKYSNFSVGKMALLVNFFVYFVCLLLFDVPTVIYSIIFTMIQSFVIDKVHFQNICIEVTIFTKEKEDEIRNFIQEELGRGTSYWHAKGGYTDEENTIIYTIISKHLLVTLLRFINNYNPNAFVVTKYNVSVYLVNFIKKI